ncbi:nucleotide exchange factor GrpE [Candidatus Vidania fulgoroideorum]
MKKYKKNIIFKIIDIIDNLEILNVYFKKNFKKIFLRFLSFSVKDFDIRTIKPNKFDEYNPYIHQAVFLYKKERKLKIYKVLKKGYIFRSSIIRPALVCLF